MNERQRLAKETMDALTSAQRAVSFAIVAGGNDVRAKAVAAAVDLLVAVRAWDREVEREIAQFKNESGPKLVAAADVQRMAEKDSAPSAFAKELLPDIFGAAARQMGDTIRADQAEELARLATGTVGRSTRYPWNLAPVWANYAATDRNGKAFWYEGRPVFDKLDADAFAWSSTAGQSIPVMLPTEPLCPDWKESKEARPMVPPAVGGQGIPYTGAGGTGHQDP